MSDGVSIIICCYNSSEKIESVLFHIEKQITNGILWEVILVDNASNDNTAEVAQQCWTRKDIQLKIVFESKPGLSNARRKGLHVSIYSIVSIDSKVVVLLVWREVGIDRLKPTCVGAARS